jgi:hypothetical protein
VRHKIVERGGIMQRFEIDGAYGTYRLAENEQLTTALLNDLVVAGLNAQVLNVDLLVEITKVNAERSVLEAYNSFTWSGTVQRNEGGQAVTYAVFRRCVKSAGSVDGNLAIAPPTMAPTPLEVESVELMRRRMSEPVDEARIAALQAGRNYTDQGYLL